MGKRNYGPLSSEPPDENSTPVSDHDIPENTLLVDVLGNKWKLGKIIGTGGFGQIYLASNHIYDDVSSNSPFAAKIENHSSGPLFVEIHCYLRIAKLASIDSWKQKMQMEHLAVPHYITSGSHQIGNNKYRFLILPHYEKDLDTILDVKRKFNLKTTLTIGLQIIDALEYIHSCGYVHLDIKASNILFNTKKHKKSPTMKALSPIAKSSYRYRGCRPIRTCKVRKLQRVLRTNFNLQSLDEDCVTILNNNKTKSIDEIYLLDYGLASRYVTSTGEHKPFVADGRRAHAGTLLFCSRDAHMGIQCRRSDLECLGYNFIYWLTSDLPWSKHLDNPETVHEKKTSCIQNVRTFLEHCFNNDFPRFLYDYFIHINDLEFKGQPNYKYIKTLFRNALREYGYKDNLLLDFDNLEGWGRKQKKTKCESDHFKRKRVVHFIDRSPLKSNVRVRNNLRKPKKLLYEKDWAQTVADPEEIIKEAKVKVKKTIDSSDSNQNNGIQNNGIQNLNLHALNPTAAMVGVFNRCMARINNGGNILHHKENIFVKCIKGYTPAMLEIYNRMNKPQLQNIAHCQNISSVARSRCSKRKRRVVVNNKKKVLQENMIKDDMQAKEETSRQFKRIIIKQRAYSLRG